MSRRFVLPLLCAVLASCSEPSSPTGGAVLLKGDPDAPAVNAVEDLASGDLTTPDEISVDADGAEIDRTNLDITFADQATTGEVNAVLQSVHATIIGMLAGVNVVLVKIPDPGNLDALDAVVTKLESEPTVIAADKAYLPRTDSLPGNYDWLTSDLTYIDHHLAVRAPAAWNATNALSYPASDSPVLLVGDFFGDGTPNSDFSVVETAPSDFHTGRPNIHGYHVLGIISGIHNHDAGDTAKRDLVTGMCPKTIDLRVTDFAKFNVLAGENHMVQALKDAGKHVVVNTSLGLPCGMPPQPERQKRNGMRWLRKVRGQAALMTGAPGLLETSYIHFTSAGNFAGGADTMDAVVNSSWTAAKLMDGLTVDIGPTTVPVANLTNTMVVENRMNTAAPAEPGCLDPSSKYPGDLSAIGNTVFSYTGATTGELDLDGTSMATPQAAGVALLVWTLDPTLTPQELSNLLIKTARTMPGDGDCPDSPSSVVDAYAAVLAADKKSALDVGGKVLDAPARLAVLDVVGDSGKAGSNQAFDDYDLEKIINELELSAGLNLDYSRYDLNGDGYTGGLSRKAPFNLNIDDEFLLDSATQDIDGEPITFDERNVGDWQVLCYYTYSELYRGDPVRRDLLMAPHKIDCGGTPNNDYVLFSKYVSSTGAANLEVFSMDSSGLNQDRLTNNSGPDTAAKLSPDGSTVVYRSGLNADIWKVDRLGDNPVNLINDPQLDQYDDTDPEWSPDGSQIVFLRTRSQGGSGQGYWVYVMNQDGSNRHRLVTDGNPALETGPTWSPVGSKIAFTSFRDGNYEIYTVNLDGTGLTRLTTDPCCTSLYDIDPAWSPGGSKIYFRSDRDGNWEIYSMNADGSAQTNLTNSPENENAFMLSPEGSKITFQREVAGGNDIFVMSNTGTNLVNVTNTANEAEGDAIWSPDSTKVMFAAFNDIYFVNADGTGLTNASKDGAGSFPTDWQL